MSEISRIGARGSRVVKHGNTLYIGGQTATDLDGGITVQARQALEKVDRLLALADSGRTKVLSATLWLKSMSDYQAMNAVWDEWIDQDHPPVRCCGAVEMADPRMLFEVIVTAAI
ncbi:RidA family protein [Trinickia dinghuensis]|uniref:RidA family protein n=1 Tax=Trinickia dinghuensis TaxID=2291023 RepID=A0A3D8JTZ5_9BURK|nr:RidA family protein [Trinickia dinghuensis]RDU95861.1 RidA family protein [Trinickia dinghuensis]